MSNPIMTFNGSTNNDIYLVRGRSKSAFHPLNRIIVSNGKTHRITKTEKGLLTIDQPIGFVAKTDEKHMDIVERLTDWLITKDWSQLSFSDELGRSYLAVLQDGVDLEKIAWLRQGTLSFIAKATLGQQKTIQVTTTPTNHTITGQDETPWSVEVVFTEATDTFELKTNRGLYLLLGYNFIEGDRLTIKYKSREVWLNGEDLRHAVRLKTNYEMLEPGIMEVSASHDCKLFYDERYY